jgi:hypothetical protein
VSLTVTPDLLAPVRAGLQPVQGTRLLDGTCLQVVVTPEAAADTIRAATALAVDLRPQLWIPDSSLWEQQLDGWDLREEGSLASSPIVIASSAAVVRQLGWAERSPTWASALSGLHPVAIPDLQSNASGVLSILGLWQTLGRKAAADQAVAAAVLASTRSTAPTPAFVVAAAAKDDPAAPVLVTSEVDVFAINRGNPASRLVAVYPTNGSPFLDYPILRVTPQRQTTSLSIGTDTVVAALRSPATREAVRRVGLRDATGAGINPPAVGALDIPDLAEVTAFLKRLRGLTLPARLTTVIDVSRSMRTVIGGGMTRAQLAGRAAISAGDLMSDQCSVGLWIFSRNLVGETAFRQLDQLEPMGQLDAGITHRAAVDAHLLTLDSLIGGDGTALYATVLAAMESALAHYDPGSDNGVILFTDGVNDDPGGLTRPQLLAQLKQLADPARPLRLIAIGLGQDIDLATLREIVAPSQGAAYVATTPDQLRTIMFDAMAHRTF